MGSHSSMALAERNGPEHNSREDCRSAAEIVDKRRKIITLVLVSLGFLALLYPVVSTQFNNQRQAAIAARYDEVLKEIPQEKRSEMLERAREYNRKDLHSGPILDPWLARITPDNTEYQHYLGQLNAAEAMVRLRIPDIGVDLPVMHGTAPHTLEHGVGHLYGSALPVGGEGTHSVLTGHTGLANATLFDNVSKLNEGESFYIQVMGETLKYEIDQVKVVRPDETDDLRPVAGRDLVTLVTCTPYGINTHRLLVRGTRVPLEKEDTQRIEEAKPSVWQWWMTAILVAIIVLLILLAWLFARAWRPKIEEGNGDAADQANGSGHPSEFFARNDEENLNG